MKRKKAPWWHNDGPLHWTMAEREKEAKPAFLPPYFR